MMIEVPEIRVTERVELASRETGVLIIDMQNDFVNSRGKLFVPKANLTIEPIRRLIEKARRANVSIFYTKDSHRKDDPEHAIWGEHTVEGTWGEEIIDELSPREEDIIIKKTRYDAFYGTPLDEYLRLKGIKNIVISGTVANICVLHTAGSAALRWYKIILPKDAISAISEFDYQATLRQIEFLYRGIITNVDGILFK